jgi:exodeoxyribonuclease V gamma subunit
MVLHGNRLEDLRDLLTQFLQSQPLPPLVPEVILVQSNGMKHWLEMALADDSALGICAATRLELPSGYLWQIYRSVLGANAVPPHMPFDKNSLLWRLVRLLPALAVGNPVYAPLERYLSENTDGRKLYQLAMQVADVLDGYQSYRADWLDDWAEGVTGQDILRTDDGNSTVLEESHAWQAQLWRDIRADVGDKLSDASRSTVHAKFMEKLKTAIEESKATGQRPAGLPIRLVVFGISSLPMQTVEALAELGQVCQVLMLVQNPCQHYWGDIVEGHDQLREQMRRRQVAKPVSSSALDTDSLHAATHPLLASWGKQGRDYLHLLDNYDRVENYQNRLTRVDVFVDPEAGQDSPSQLNQLQSAILNLQSLPVTPVALVEDTSITLITTHSAQREVEVLHDRLLTWFDADPALNPRDVMVMVPDMEAFAPHIQAVFGRFTPGQPRHIPYSVADTTPRQSPLVQALDQLLSLPGSRVSLADWLGLFEVAAVRTRFGVTEADVAQLQNWLTLAGVRWGLDTSHRMAWGMPDGVDGLDQNTWAFGLRRLLLGYAVGGGVGAGAPWGGTLPQAALGGLDATLISALLNWVEAINLTLMELSGDKSPEQWGIAMVGIVERFFKPSDDAEDRLIQRCLAPLEVWLQACEDARLDAPLPLDVVREHWLSQIEEPSLHQRFFGGGVQFGTLMPMRSIPFKAICLLGMNDGDYPRQKAARDFDLMAQSWRAGDRSRREDDRYLFLEAILSARQKLYISWQGHRPTDNTEQPPSVLVAQLIEYLQAGWTPALKPEKQPLQPFSETYFLRNSPFQTYDQDWARVHEAQVTQAPQEPGNSASPLAAPSSLTLADLRQLMRQPVEVFFKSRLQVRLDTVDELEQLEEPFSLNGLEQYQAGQDLLNAGEMPQAIEKLTLSGKLPMAAFGTRLAQELQAKTQVVLDRQAEWKPHYLNSLPAQSISLNVGGIAITGTLEGLWSGDAGWLQLNQRVGAVLEGEKDAQTARGHVVASLWVNHVVACANGMPVTSVQLGLDGQVVFNPLTQENASEILGRLVNAYLAAWTRPLPVACKTAWAFLQAQAQADRLAIEKPDKEPRDPHEAAQAAFDGGHYAGERTESAYLARAFESYDDIELELPGWADLLYGDMAQQAQLAKHAGVAA